MWNGLTSLIFGASNADAESSNQSGRNAKPLLITNDSDWVVVEHKDDDEVEKFLNDSVLLRSPEISISPSLSKTSLEQQDSMQAHASTPTVRRTYPPRRTMHRPAPSDLVPYRGRPYTCAKDALNVQRSSRNALKRANRAYDVQTGCRQQRAFNYDIRNSSRC